MRNGRLDNARLTDTCGDVLLGAPMGMSAELCANEHSISRSDMDDDAAESYRRAANATAGSKFTEISAVTVTSKRGETTTVVADDEVCAAATKCDAARVARPTCAELLFP